MPGVEAQWHGRGNSHYSNSHAPEADLVRGTLREGYAVVGVGRQILVDGSDGGEMTRVGARGEAREKRQRSEERWDRLVREEAKFADLGLEGAGSVGEHVVVVHRRGHRNVADRRVRREARGRDLVDVGRLLESAARCRWRGRERCPHRCNAVGLCR